MSNFLLGIVVGALIGWLFEYFLYRQRAEARATEQQNA